ncbi:MAG: hypothetical protein HWE24_17315 [Oceanospirillaceae bacterium]|nr:hypothetical protein [Oceanospirillaceae bacterium]
MIRVKGNGKLIAQKRYVVEDLLSSFFTEQFEYVVDEQIEGYSFESNGKQLHVPDVFFSDESTYLTKESIPSSLSKINLVLLDGKTIELPMLFGVDLSNRNSDGVQSFGIDIIGSVFFLVSGYEDYILSATDSHGRLPSEELLSVKENFFQIPILNYYLSAFTVALQNVGFKGVNLREYGELYFTIDVDHPSTLNLSFKKQFKTLIKDLIRYRDLGALLRRKYTIITKSVSSDPYNFVPFLGYLKKKYALNVVVFFMNIDKNGTKHDETYSWNTSFIKYYLKECNRHNFSIGLHPSYNTGDDQALLRSELKSFRNSVDYYSMNDSRWVRHHYLRLNPGFSWRTMSEQGFEKDSTVGFADRLGFKAGLCFPYRLFDLKQNKTLDLVEYPFAAMDRTFINLGEPKEDLIRVVEETKRFHGNFVYLAHNCELGYSKGKNTGQLVVAEYMMNNAEQD